MNILEINFYFRNKFVYVIENKQKKFELFSSTSFIIVIIIDDAILSQTFLRIFTSQNYF